MTNDMPLTLTALRDAYAGGATPADIIRDVYRRIEAVGDPAIFIHLRPMDDVIAEADALPARSAAQPLWGVPFVAKDNIDVAGIPTTAACPAYAITIDGQETDRFIEREPERFDIDRTEEPPHLNFGGGIFSCIGRYAVTMEVEQVIARLAAEFPRLKIEDSRFSHSPMFTSVDALTARLT